ncbi:hypothetical protein HGM15179_012181 [Zosterops borbonicus]|uniref:Uncharacterized protein n=1 Tax=Zosterops borbonicus TaxID=364589 RepID=A0A8K1GB34_9PASS|nr:hypothetical protein HGM15179_012181 [Zosterops borbonicus]
MQSSKVTISFQIWYSQKSAGPFPACDNFKTPPGHLSKIIVIINKIIRLQVMKYYKETQVWTQAQEVLNISDEESEGRVRKQFEPLENKAAWLLC